MFGVKLNTMKKTISIICLCFYFITPSQVIFAQERLQSIEKGISLLGVTKPAMQSYLKGRGFRFDNQTRSGDMIDYSKEMRYGRCHFSFHGNNKIDGISWREDATLGQDFLSEVKALNFQIKLNMVGDIKAFSCYNYSQNVIVSLIFRQEDNYFSINIGKIDPAKGLAKTYSNSEPKVKTVTEANNKYIVTAQKAYFYDKTPYGGSRKKAYLVEGEIITSQKEKDGFIYVEFTNAILKKITKGWLCKTDIEIKSDEQGILQINKISANSPFAQLVNFDKAEDVKKVYNNVIISQDLKRIMGTKYPAFYKEFISNDITGDVTVRHNVLYIKSFLIHNATVNAYYFIDLHTGQSFLYSSAADNDGDTVSKIFGSKPLPPAIAEFVKLYLISNKDFIDESDVGTLNKLLEYK